jgi:hypothetical protein
VSGFGLWHTDQKSEQWREREGERERRGGFSQNSWNVVEADR